MMRWPSQIHTFSPIDFNGTRLITKFNIGRRLRETENFADQNWSSSNVLRVIEKFVDISFKIF